MDLNGFRRASSAGYRLPERHDGTRPVSSELPTERTRRSTKEPTSPEQNPDRADTVKQDEVWKDVVRSEKRGAQEWEKNWAFLRNYDQMGQLKPEEATRSSTLFFSEHLPHTSSHMFGSRLSTPLGSEVVRMDRRLLWSASHRKRKQDPEMLPC